MSGCGSNMFWVLLSMIPVPGTIAPQPKRPLIVWVISTTLPSTSATARSTGSTQARTQPSGTEERPFTSLSLADKESQQATRAEQPKTKASDQQSCTEGSDRVAQSTHW